MLIGGVQGIVPDDVNELVKGIAYYMFGKDFDIHRETRKFIADIVGGETADLIMHGTARYGFGIPKLAHMLGANFVPDVDVSNSVTLNRVLPISIRGLTVPGASWEDFISQNAQNVAGASFGIPLGMLRALSGNDLEITDLKRWENAMPAAFRNVTKMMRLYFEGGDRTRGYASTIQYDGEDPEQLGELIALGMGFKSTRVNQIQEMNQTERDLNNFWAARKQMLLREAFRALYVHKDKEEYRNTLNKIKDFNLSAPDRKMRITPDVLKASFSSRLKGNQKIEMGNNVSPGIKSQVDQLYPGVRELARKPVK